MDYYAYFSFKPLIMQSKIACFKKSKNNWQDDLIVSTSVERNVTFLLKDFSIFSKYCLYATVPFTLNFCLMYWFIFLPCFGENFFVNDSMTKAKKIFQTISSINATILKPLPVSQSTKCFTLLTPSLLVSTAIPGMVPWQFSSMQTVFC